MYLGSKYCKVAGYWGIGVILVSICLFFCMIRANAANVMELSCTVTEEHSVLLEWQSDSMTEVFEIQKSQGREGEYTTVAVVSEQTGVVKCYDYDVKMGETYYYRIIRKNGEEITGESNVVEVRITLSKPDSVKAKIIKESRVQLSWHKVKGAKSYVIYRSNKKDKGYKEIVTTSDCQYTDYNVSKGKVYYYKVAAIHKNKEYSGETCEPVEVIMKPEAPSVVGSYNKKRIKLTWKKVKGAETYYVYKKKNNKFKLLGKTSKLNYSDSKVKKGKTYEYKVVAAYEVNGKVIKSSEDEICKIYADTIDPNKKMVALTYDDGPGQYTDAIVKCLKDNQGRATFFVLGSRVNSYKNAVKTADELGCEIANHSYSHSNLTRLSEAEIKEEMNKTDAVIKKVIGKTTTLMRTPGGATSQLVQKNVGKPIILWSIDTRDWEHRDSKKTIASVMNNVKDGDIVLMHDIHEATKVASLELIPRLRREGYQLVTVSELAKYRGIDMQKGQIYHHLRKKK